MISSTQNKELSSGNDEMEAELDAGGSRRQAGFSLCIAKISQGLRKFRNPCENFVMHIVSLSYRNFAIIAKI